MSRKSISPRTVFVLDVSGSMSGYNRLETLNLAVKRYIEDIPNGYYVGIVLFESRVWIQHQVVQITDRSVRDSLIASCPSRTYGDNDFAGGLLLALTALRNAGLSTEGATFVFVTDGEDTWSGPHYGAGLNYVDIALPDLLSAKVRVVCIGVGHGADPNLERLAKETSGNTHIVTDTNREMAVRVFEAAFAEVKTSTEMSEATTITVSNDIMSINTQSVNKNVIIDSDIGRNTNFTVGSEDIDKLSLSITSPNGQKYDSTSSELARNQTLKRYQLKLKSAEPGIWTISLIKHTNQTISATVLVTSQPVKPNAVQLRVMLKDADTSSQTPPLIFAELRKGDNIVIGAEVTATIDKPNGTQTKISLNNYNNVYINYFTDYCGSGRYNVSVLAQSKGDNCQLKPIRGRGGTASGSLSVSQFERQLIAGCFKVESFMPSKPSNDQKLQELSLNESFKALTMNSGSFNLPVESPAPRTAKAIIKPSAPKQSDEIKVAKEKLWKLFLSVKKSLNSSKICDTDKKAMRTAIEEIDAFMTSTKSSTIKEVDSYREKLESMKQKLS